MGAGWVGRFWEAVRALLYWVAAGLVALVITFWISGCASLPGDESTMGGDAYWFRAVLPVRDGAVAVVVVDGFVDCGGVMTIGCYDWATHTITVARRSAGLMECVTSHEKGHAEGWTHVLGPPTFGWVCGDGRVYVALEK